jgi:ABC-type sugar transport system substrate-binding protein
MTTAALLLDDPKNRYQQLLVREARAHAEALGVELLPPQFADGSAWAQVESINGYLRAEHKPQAVMVMLAGTLSARSAVERLARAGISLVLLNRLADWLGELRDRYPQVLVAGVAPEQDGIGRLQARQAERLAAPGAFVILLTGTASSAAAIERRRGFLEGVKQRFSIQELDGSWSSAGAQAALSTWFQLGAQRDRPPSLVVCQNDAMAEGARAMLSRQAAAAGRPELERVPLIGCDGLAEEGVAMVARRELAATVVLPATTPTAMELLKAHREGGAPPEVTLLEAASFPPLAQIAAR